MLEKFCENFLLKLRAAESVLIERLKTGGFKTLEDYKHVVGKIQGLEHAEIMIKETYQAMIEMKHLKQHRDDRENEQVDD